MAKTKDELAEKKTIERRDQGLAQLLKTPPKPHKEVGGKSKPKRKKPKSKPGPAA